MEDAELSLPMEYHSLLPENKSTTRREDDSSTSTSSGSIFQCVTALWSGLKKMWSSFFVYCMLWEAAEEYSDHNRGFKEGKDNNYRQSVFQRLADFCLHWSDTLPSNSQPEAPLAVHPVAPSTGHPAVPELSSAPLFVHNSSGLVIQVTEGKYSIPITRYDSLSNKAMSHVKGFHQMLVEPQTVVLTSKTGCKLNVVHQLGSIGSELHDLLSKMNPMMGNNAGSIRGSAHQRINPRRLLQKVNQRDNNNNRFDGSSQQDSHEFLRCLLQYIKDEQVQCITNEIENCVAPGLTDELKLEYRQATNAGASMLEREVGGAYSSTIICRDCFKPVQKKEPFFDLSLSIPDKQAAWVCRRETPDLREEEDISVSYNAPGAINEDNENLNRQEIVTSPTLCLSPNPGNNNTRNSTVNPIATEFRALQEYLRNKGFHYHPPSLERPMSNTDLEQALLDYTNVDVLDDDQRFICNQCNKENRLVSKQALIMQLQKVLILHIKRFEFNTTSVTKNNDFLSFELLLDMAPYCTNGCLQKLMDKNGRILYGLKAVVKHKGRTLNSGHYVAYVRRSAGQQATETNSSPSQSWEYDQNAVNEGDWYKTSDQTITKCLAGFAEVRRINAYLLFYELLPKL